MTSLISADDILDQCTCASLCRLVICDVANSGVIAFKEVPAQYRLCVTSFVCCWPTLTDGFGRVYDFEQPPYVEGVFQFIPRPIAECLQTKRGYRARDDDGHRQVAPVGQDCLDVQRDTRLAQRIAEA